MINGHTRNEKPGLGTGLDDNAYSNDIIKILN